MTSANIITMPRSAKRLLLLVSDAVVLIAALWLSFSLRLDEAYWPAGGFTNSITWLVLAAPVIAVPGFVQFGLYRAIIRYLGMRAAWSVVKAVALYAVLWGLLALLSGVPGIPRSVVVINAMVALLGVGGSRMLARWLLRWLENSTQNGSAEDKDQATLTRVVVFGAGEAGRQLAVGLNQSKQCKLMAFVDDEPVLQGRDLMSLPILAPDQLESFVTKNKVDDILLAVPSISRKHRNAIIERLRPLKVRVRTLPGLLDMAKGSVDYAALLDLDIDDLLAREPAACDEHLMQAQVHKQVVMVTGSGGSIGSELCRQILKRKPKTLLLFELNEFALFTIHDELAKAAFDLANDQTMSKPSIALVPQIIPLLGSVHDESRLSDVLLTWQPDIIYHAAALKHVPLVEQNIAEGVKTNVLGTLTLAKAALERQVDRLVLISTDKAVNPTNAMGASKRCCELVLQALAAESMPEFTPVSGNEPASTVKRTTQFSMVRFGNVLGSSGSVVPYFREQIKRGGPVTLTHADITRYFMTIPEAAQLVMQAGAMANSTQSTGNQNRAKEVDKTNNAEVYVLDMGEPVKIIDLAKRMIQLSGHQIKDDLNPNGDIEIDIVGLRPGEKLYEELLIGNNPQTTQHPRIMKAQEHHIDWRELQPMLGTMQIAADNGDVLMIRTILQQLVPEYQPDEKVADWVYREQIAQAEKLER